MQSGRTKFWPDVQNWREIEGEIWLTTSVSVPGVLISWLVSDGQLVPCTARGFAAVTQVSCAQAEVPTGRYTHCAVCRRGLFLMSEAAFDP